MSSDEDYFALLDRAKEKLPEVAENHDRFVIPEGTDNGLYLAGGGSKLIGFPQKIEEYLGVKVHHLEDPAHSVVKGAAVALKKSELLKNVDYQMRSLKELEIE